MNVLFPMNSKSHLRNKFLNTCFYEISFSLNNNNKGLFIMFYYLNHI